MRAMKKKKEDKLTVRDIAVAERLFGLKFSNAERDSMIRSVNRNLESFHAIHEFSLENRIAPALVFNPIHTGFQPDRTSLPGNAKRVQREGWSRQYMPAWEPVQ